MKSSIDALFNEFVNHSDPYSSTGILSQLLGRQSLAEIDHNRGLKAALQLAKECKSLLRTEFFVQALVVFVKAFATSPFCLESLEEVTEKLVSALDRALRLHVSRCEGSKLPIPLVCKAAKLIMLGFDMLPVPPLREAIILLSDSGGAYQQWEAHEAVHMLSNDQLSWVIALAGFKTCYRLGLQCSRDRRRRNDYYAHWKVFAEEAIECLDKAPMAYEYHPFVLQGTVQWHMFMADLDQPFVSHWDAMQEVKGYDTAVFTLGDPALAVTHLVQSMYTNLQVTDGKPTYNEKKQLRKTADRIMQCINVLESDPSVWDSVRGSILATLFLLAHSWDLSSLLAISSQAGDHVLVSFLNEQHSMHHELLLRAEAGHEPTFEELAQGLEEMNSLVEGLPADTRSGEEEEFIDMRCTRCERRIRTKNEAMECQQCHSAFYCSPDCQRKHAQSHKGPCKRAKLKAKLAAKPSTK